MQGLFNGAFSFIEELSTIRRRLHDARLDHNYDAWYNLLVAYYIALSARFATKLQNYHDDMYKECKHQYNIYMSYKAKGKKSVPSEIYDKFFAWEMQLRKAEDKVGLLMKNADDPALAMAGVNY